MGEQAATKQVEHGSSSHGYGAELTTRQFAVLIIAIALGTLLECECGLSAKPLSQHAAAALLAGERYATAAAWHCCAAGLQTVKPTL
jgi:hypothetical protein